MRQGGRTLWGAAALRCPGTLIRQLRHAVKVVESRTAFVLSVVEWEFPLRTVKLESSHSGGVFYGLTGSTPRQGSCLTGHALQQETIPKPRSGCAFPRRVARFDRHTLEVVVSEGILAAVLIVAIVVGAACYAVRHLNKTAGRIAAVISAMAFLVAALVPVVKILVESPPVPAPVVAPAVPAEPHQAQPQTGAGTGGGIR